MGVDADCVVGHDLLYPAGSIRNALQSAGCDRCRRLMRLLDEGPDVPAPSARQLKQIRRL